MINVMTDLISEQAANTKMKKYRKKPIVIDAYQTDVALDIETLEGVMHASVGDYIITGVNGERYPCKPDIFKKTYEEIFDNDLISRLDSDSISRHAAIDYFVTNVGFYDEDGYPIEDSDELRKIWTEYFNGIPSVQSIDSVKYGEWDDGRCTQCGFKAIVAPFTINLDTGERTLILKFCPNCGVRMKTGEEV